ncbi:MAG TPA: hypothetical protein VK116_09585 [Planctomycetota bacterium]|nr:hypothetical protein [Planctomycetota bacterium]
MLSIDLITPSSKADPRLERVWPSVKSWFERHPRVGGWTARFDLPRVRRPGLRSAFRALERVAFRRSSGSIWAGPDAVRMECVSAMENLDELERGGLRAFIYHYSIVVSGTELELVLAATRLPPDFRRDVSLTLTEDAFAVTPRPDPESVFRAAGGHALTLAEWLEPSRVTIGPGWTESGEVRRRI